MINESVGLIEWLCDQWPDVNIDLIHLFLVFLAFLFFLVDEMDDKYGF